MIACRALWRVRTTEQKLAQENAPDGAQVSLLQTTSVAALYPGAPRQYDTHAPRWLTARRRRVRRMLAMKLTKRAALATLAVLVVPP